MKIALITSLQYDPNQGVAGVTSALGDEMRAQGARVDQFFMGDFQMFSGEKLGHLLFPGDWGSIG